MKKSSYYTDQLNALQLGAESNPSIKIVTNYGSTKHLNINAESAADLIEWLKTNFINK